MYMIFLSKKELQKYRDEWWFTFGFIVGSTVAAGLILLFTKLCEEGG